MFAESKDEIALVLFGTSETDNPLVDGDSYEHVTIARHLGLTDFDLLHMVQNDIRPGDTPADCILSQGFHGRFFIGWRRDVSVALWSDNK